MVAYAYAAQFPQETERARADGRVPARHRQLEGRLADARPVALPLLRRRRRSRWSKGRERIYFEHFWNDFAADPKKSVSEADRRLYAAAYAQPGGMRAGFEYFRNFEQDAKDFARARRDAARHAGAGADRREGLRARS